jgi:small acid-soluble spore protein (thioredoxin-like protein)
MSHKDNKPKPDDRRDNVKKIQHNINMTIHNMEAAEEAIANTSNEKTRQELIEKNERREDALSGMRHEIKDEAEWQKRNK